MWSYTGRPAAHGRGRGMLSCKASAGLADRIPMLGDKSARTSARIFTLKLLGLVSIRAIGLLVRRESDHLVGCCSRVAVRPCSDPHRHHNIPVLVIFAFRGTQLPSRLGILQLQLHFA